MVRTRLLQKYLLKLAKPGKWLFDKSFVTDQAETKIVENTVTAKLMDFLPNAVPYTIKVELEFFNRTAEGSELSSRVCKCTAYSMLAFFINLIGRCCHSGRVVTRKKYASQVLGAR